MALETRGIMDAGIAGLIGSMVAGAIVGVAADHTAAGVLHYIRRRPDFEYKRFIGARADADAFRTVARALHARYAELGHESLDLPSGLYPCVTFPAVVDDPESLFTRPLLRRNTGAPVAPDMTYRRAIGTRLSTPLFNGGVYPMVTLDPDTAALSCSYMDEGYYSVLDTCVSLEYEAFLASSRHRSPKKLLPARRMPLRERLHEGVADPVLHGDGRVAGVGGSTVVVYNNGSEYRAIVAQRSNRGVAAGRLQFAVAPTFMVQAQHGDIDGEYSVTHNVLREYCEELQAQDLRQVVDPRTVKMLDCYLQIEEMLRDGRAVHLALGVVVNLLELRPDVCTLLVVHDPEWVKTLRLSDEFSVTFRQSQNTPRVDALVEALPDRGLPYEPHQIIPACAGALWLALGKIAASDMLGVGHA